MRDSRSSEKKSDPREDPGMVKVRNYTRDDGTDVESHERKRPVIKARLRMEISDFEARVKGTIREFDSEGKQVNKTRLNETLHLDHNQGNRFRKLEER